MTRLSNALPRSRHLIDAPALACLLKARAGAIVLEVGTDAGERFRRGHIPGALWLDMALLETGPLFNKVDDDALLSLLLSRGIRHDSTVVVYDRANSLPAARAAHLLLYAGVLDVRLLDGGYGAWQAAGGPCREGAALVAAAALTFGAGFPARPEYLCGTPIVQEHLRSGSAILASIRTLNEYTGRTSGYCYISARGEIPGARWGRAGREGDVHSMSDYQTAEGRMLPAAAIAAMWAESGITPGAPTVFYCGTGWRASLAFFYAYVMGWEHISVYDGGWFEWSGDPANPVVCRAFAQAPAVCGNS